MQHTNKYKLNLIEKDDTFSPDPLNDNMEKVEGALEGVTAHADAGDAAEAQARADADAALDQRLQAIEAHHVAVGTYTPSNNLDIDVGFSPLAVIIIGGGGNHCGMLMQGTDNSIVKVTSHGFLIKTSGTGSINHHSYTYGYVAFN